MTPDIGRGGYSATSMFFHWTLAFVLIGLYALGLVMEDLGDEARGTAISLHKSLGVLVVALAFARLLWRIIDTNRPEIESGPAWQRGLAATTHAVLYILMVAIPVSGILMSTAGGHPVSVFGLFDLPVLMGRDEQTHEVLEEVHEVLATTMIWLVAVHAAAAAWHQWMMKDGTLSRMLPHGNRR